MKFRSYIEATAPYIEKIIDPALLTWTEFWKLVNPDDKWHPEDAYNWSVHQMKQQKSEYPTLINRRDINGISFEFRMNKQDFYQDNVYAKRDLDGEYVRINNVIQYYTKEELLKLGKYNRYGYSFGVFHGNQCVGVAQDEWGCLLVGVAAEYRRFGLGKILTKMAWEAEPGKNTGGCTSKGAAVTRKVHTEFVREYLQKGFYSHLVKNGKLTTQRVNEILKSAMLDQEKVSKQDLGTDDPNNWLMYHEDGTFILYDKKFKDHYQEEDNFWKERCVKAIGDVGGMLHENENYRLRTLGGDTEGLKKFMLMCCLTWTAEEDNKPLYVYEEDLSLVDDKIGTIDKRGERKNGWVTLTAKPIDYKPLEKTERNWRKKFDPYNEFHIILMETAYAKYQQESPE